MQKQMYLKNYERWLTYDGLDTGLREELLSIRGNDEAIAERFSGTLGFGTGGMRGLLGAGTDRINIYTIMKATAGFAAYIASSGNDAAARGVVISHDNRRFSREFTLATAGVFAAAGIKAYIFDGLRPTPELSFAVRRLGAAGGVMITASHNPPEYNGYKIYDHNGCQLNIEDSEKVISEINKIKDELSVPCLSPEEAGDLITVLGPETDDEYCMRVHNISIERDRDAASKLKVVYSPQHGTGNVPVRRVLSEAGYEVIPVLSQCEPDPDFSGTPNPNPENPAAYIAAMEIAEEKNADIVITTDPDCDRLGVAARRNGKMVLMTGNQSAAVLLEYIFSRLTARGEMPSDPLMVSTIVTSDLGDRIAEKYGVSVEKTLTGFKFIGEKIALHRALHDKNYVFGYEESYGCLISDFVRDKDGVQASLMLCEAAAYYKSFGKTLVDVLDDIYREYGYYLDTQSNFYFRGLNGQEQISALTASLRKNAPSEVDGVAVLRVEDYLSPEMQAAGFPSSDVLRFIFADKCWVAVRPSGTEPKCKFYYCICASDKDAAEKRFAGLKSAFEPKA
ncbi:MAG: phospho-sugar mutase [Clostridia bacterium]|nr:phospho-sugar mutase [Clostridia bacterium]